MARRYRDRLNRLGPRPEAEVERVLHDLAEALAYAHASGVVHRDLKPENIFWYGERALLADFGIASVMHGTASDTAAPHRTQGIVGTANYMSPEQVGGEPLDGRSDLYSLGCVAFELLAGDVALRPRLVRRHTRRPRDRRGSTTSDDAARDQRRLAATIDQAARMVARSTAGHRGGAARVVARASR